MNRLSLLSRWKRPQICYLQPESSFEDWCRKHAGTPCHLIVSSRLMHEMTFEADLPLHSDVERHAYARQQFAHYFGSAAQRWPLAVREGGASALQGVDLEALQATANAHGVALRAAEPFWAQLLRHLRKIDPDWMQAPKAAIAWVDGSHCSWIVLEHGQLQSIRQLRLREASQAALEEALPTFDASVRVLQADLQLLASPDLEGAHISFLPLRRRAPALAWGLLATSLIVLATSAWDARSTYQALAAARSQEASLQSRSTASSLRHAPVAPASKADADLQRRAGEAQALLQLPWEPLLSSVEQIGAKGQISWLGMDVNAARMDLHLDGLAPDKLLALQLADRMGGQPGWQQVMLGRLQQADGGLQGQRFDISARFSTSIGPKDGT